MQRNTYRVMAASLLHDVGKVLVRAGKGNGSHGQRGAAFLREMLPVEILRGIQYHHRAELEQAAVEKNDIAYITYLADSISAGTDKRATIEGKQEQGFPKDRALESIFNHIGVPHKTGGFNVGESLDQVQFPTEGAKNDADAYTRIWNGFFKSLKEIEWSPEYANALLELIQRYFAYVPSSPATQERCDISLFHHSKTTAAIGCCLEEYLRDGGRTDYKTVLFDREQDFLKEKAFVLFSLDMSGIQSFIYTINNKGALKGLRARSFYLSVLMEDVADSILEAVGLGRTNLIYCGGGRAHLLLPNIPAALQAAETVVSQTNVFLRKHFGISLYLASGYCTCSGLDLTSNNGEDDAFVRLFRETSLQMSGRKMSRYGAEELRELNAMERGEEERECVICGGTGKMVQRAEETLCENCDRLEKFAAEFKESENVLIVETEKSPAALPLPQSRWLRSASENKARALLRDGEQKAIRFYGINRSYPGMKRTTRLSVGNYGATDGNVRRLSFEEMAEKSEGVRRLGVFRADVDNLGAMFANGFKVEGAKNPWRFTTLSRYTALSLSLTDFFQREINRIVRGKQKRNVSIVYSGGDDVFLIGAWNEVLDAGLEIRKELERYTGGAVTMSAGFGFFKEDTPVAVMADTTAFLEDDAKSFRGGEKNALSLFEPKQNVYHWNEFETDIMGEKYRTIDNVISGEDENGNAFLYSVVQLLRDMKEEPMAIARLAYTLARHAPGKGVSNETKDKYDAFSKRVYGWALEPEENRKLQTAILYYVYRHRKEQ